MTSIIIVSWNVKELLQKCLKSIFDASEDFDFEVFVVDNASADGSVEMAREKFPQVILIANKKNLGFAKANNLAIKQSIGDYVLLLNPDTELMDNSIKKIVEFLCDNPEIGILGPKLLNPDKTWQPSTRRFPNIWNQLAIILKLPRIFPRILDKYLMRDFNGRTAREVDQVMGAAFLIRREVINKIGFLDERYFIWFEEVDYCKMAKKENFKIYYWPGAEIIHYGGESFAKLPTFNKQIKYIKSAIKYFIKNGFF